MCIYIHIYIRISQSTVPEMRCVSVFILIVPAKYILEGGREHPKFQTLDTWPIPQLYTSEQWQKWHPTKNIKKSWSIELRVHYAPKISWGLQCVHNVFLCLSNYLEAENLTTNANILKPNNSAERSAALILDWRNLWRLKQQSST